MHSVCLLHVAFPIDENPWHTSFMEGWVHLAHIIIALWPYIVAAVSELIQSVFYNSVERLHPHNAAFLFPFGLEFA